MKNSVAYLAARQLAAIEDKACTKKPGDRNITERLKAWDRYNTMLEQCCGKRVEMMPAAQR